MLKLHCLENTELSEYCLSNLEKHGITLIREFISEKPEKLMKILSINFDQVKTIKREFRRIYGPKQFFYFQYKEKELRKKVYGTNIENLDNILAPKESFSSLSFWEICGPTGIGKTQLAFTIMLNFVMNQVTPALYIDTKLDFSASRIKNMLESREVQPELYAGIMSFIKVERVLSAQGVVNMLEEFHKQLQERNEEVALIKLIVIDSLPAAWFLLNAESNRLCGKWLLSRLSQIIKCLVRRYHVAVICVNLSLIPFHEQNETNIIAPFNCNNDNDISNVIDDDDSQFDGENSLSSSYRPVLGKFWLSKPNTRLSLEYPDGADDKYKEDSSLRVIKLLYATDLSSGISCSVRLQPEGFV